MLPPLQFFRDIDKLATVPLGAQFVSYFTPLSSVQHYSVLHTLRDRRSKYMQAKAVHWCRAQGDNDPVDVVEIGEQRLDMGGVYAVKPLAVLAMIDDGELDWKVVAIRSDDPRAASVNDVEDVERWDSQDALCAFTLCGGCERCQFRTFCVYFALCHFA